MSSTLTPRQTILAILSVLAIVVTACFLHRNLGDFLARTFSSIPPTTNIVSMSTSPCPYIPADTYEQLTFPDNTIDTSDWQTYRNEQYGFEVKYPQGWRIDFSYDRGFTTRPVNESAQNQIHLFRALDGVNESLDQCTGKVTTRDGFTYLSGKEGIRVNNVFGVMYPAHTGDSSLYTEIIFSIADKLFIVDFPSRDKLYAQEANQIFLSLTAIR